MLEMMRTYFTLTESRIEGIEPMAARYNLIVSTIKKKTYDVLDHRRNEADVDYEEFKKGFADIEVCFLPISGTCGNENTLELLMAC